MRNEIIAVLRQRKIMIGAVVALVIILIWFVAIFNPEGHKLASVNGSVQSAQTEQTELQARLAQLKRYSSESTALQALGAKLDAAVPSTDDVYNYVTVISDAANSTGVKVSSINPSTPTTQGSLAVIPVTISVTGTYSQILHFLDALYSLPRLTVIYQVSLSGGGSGSNRGSVLTASFSASIFAQSSGSTTPSTTSQ